MLREDWRGKQCLLSHSHDRNFMQFKKKKKNLDDWKWRTFNDDISLGKQQPNNNKKKTKRKTSALGLTKYIFINMCDICIYKTPYIYTHTVIVEVLDWIF